MIKKIRDIYGLCKDCGLDYTAMAIVRRIQNGKSDDYADWIRYVEQKSVEEKQEFAYNPLISVVVPVYNVKKEQLEDCIQSVINQSYENVQLCLSDDCSTMPEVKEVLEKYKNHSKVKVFYRSQNGHISENSNSGIALADGEFIGFLDCDDYLAENAVYEVVKELNKNKNLDFIYTDEDLVTEDGTVRYSPIFKPDWSPDTYLSHNYTNHFSVYRTSIVREIGGLRTEYNGSQDYDFVLRFTEHTTPDRIAHIPKVLYHWRVRPESVTSGTDAKPYVFDAAKRATEDALGRRKIDAHLEYEENSRQWNVVYHADKDSMVSIFLLADGRFADMEKTIASVQRNNDYENYELKLLYHPGICKISMDELKSLSQKYKVEQIVSESTDTVAGMYTNATKQCAGKYVVYMKSGVELKSSDWISLLTGHAAQAHVGFVGGKVLYPDGKIIQSIGYVKTVFGFVPAFDHNRNSNNLYTGLNHNFVCVADGVCCIEKSKLEKVGYFNENCDANVLFQEVSVRLIQNGKYQVYRPDVQIIRDVDQSFETVNMEQKVVDPFYSRNHSQGAPFSLIAFSEKQENRPKRITDGVMKCDAQGVIMDRKLYVRGIAYSNKVKRSLFDSVWIEVTYEDGTQEYAKIKKQYLYGYNRKTIEKRDRKWAGFCGTYCIEKNVAKLRVLVKQKKKWFGTEIGVRKDDR